MATTRVGGVPVERAHYARMAASLVSSLMAAMLGAVAMAVTLVAAFMLLQNTTWWHPLQVIGALLWGDRALLQPSLSVLVPAVALHLGLCVIWGVAFSLAATPLKLDKSIGASILLGLIIGFVSQIVDVDLVAPPLLRALWGHDVWADNVPAVYSWVAHLAFGLGFIAFPFLFRRFWIRFAGRADVLYEDPRIR